MRKKQIRKRRLIRPIIYLYALIVLFTLATVATYTWFAISRTPKVSDMGLSINAPAGLELSADPLAEEWSLQLDFNQLTGEMTPLRPVTWSAQDQRFYAAIYGIDGRITDKWEPLNDTRHANKNNADGYYMMGTFYARCGEPAAVKLSPAVEVEEGRKGAGTFLIGTPVWDNQRILHDNGGSGAELAVRVGIKIQKQDLHGNPLPDEATRFVIYEPNTDLHIDGTQGYVATPSIDGSATLVPEENLITQTASTWTEAYPVERNVLIHTLGEFTSDTELFEISPHELAQITVYVWLEGQDIDCTNVIGQRAQIMANLQFIADLGNHSGLEPIE